ncbi:hypothetical protein MWLf4_1503 [Limosilactobacillus fermentum]|nr:hypothetical protein MWLf4_1503 [Limosilactobacillus fermentum]
MKVKSRMAIVLRTTAQFGGVNFVTFGNQAQGIACIVK